MKKKKRKEIDLLDHGAREVMLMYHLCDSLNLVDQYQLFVYSKQTEPNAIDRLIFPFD